MRKFKRFALFFDKIKANLRFFKVDPSFFVIFILAIFLEEISLYVCFVVFLILHELVHFFVAKKLGYFAKRIKLNFFGASLEGLDDFLLQDEIKVVLAGPLFNLSVIVLCYLAFWFYPESYHYLNEILLANWAIFLFNFLPIYPLDLGRILHALLSQKYERAKALKMVKIVSLLFLIFMFVLFLVSFFFDFNFSFGFVVVNLTFLLFSSAKGTSFKRGLFVERKFKLLKRGLIERNIYVESGTENYSLFKYIDDYHFINFVFLDKTLKVSKTMSEIELYKSLGLI